MFVSARVEGLSSLCLECVFDWVVWVVLQNVRIAIDQVTVRRGGDRVRAPGMPGGAGLDPRYCQAFSVLPTGPRQRCRWCWPGLAPCGVVICHRVVVVPRSSVHFTMTRTPAEREQIRAELAARDMQISEAWVAGESVEGIARRYRLSYGRVSQIVHGRPDLRAERDRRQRATEVQKHGSVQAWSQRHPGAPLAEAAALLGLDEAELKKILGERASLHPAPRPAPAPVFSDDEIHQALVAFLAEGTVRRSDYDLVSPQRGWPSSSTVITRLGSWSTALASAGHHTTSRHIRDVTFTDAQLWEWLDRFVAATPPPWTVRRLAAWLAGQPGAPSQVLIRRRLGRWAGLKTELARRSGPRR